MLKSAVIIFPGSNCDRDAVSALEKIGSKVEKIWYQENSLPKNLDLIVIPGGFSYGDYLRSGAMAAISPAMQEVKKLAANGTRILGICNGFQILTEAGLLDGVLLRNSKIKFSCRYVHLRIENNNSDFTGDYAKKSIIRIPIAHMDGNYFTDENTLKKLQDNDQIAMRYVNENGGFDEDSNPNGSMDHIAGIFNLEKNILGMMPHPERAIDPETGSIDGLAMFQSLSKLVK
jgi:phosphoribosylformylglycinamidine synthase